MTRLAQWMRAAVLIVVGGSGCASSAESPVVHAQLAAPGRADDPCRGMFLDADAANPACRVAFKYPSQAPAREALSLRILEHPLRVKSGETASFTLEMRNVSATPVTFDL